MHGVDESESKLIVGVCLGRGDRNGSGLMDFPEIFSCCDAYIAHVLFVLFRAT